jgi:hypothetical protein
MTQNERIINWLSEGRSLTARQARNWGIKRLPARILELRNEGYSIYGATNRSGTTSYRLGQPSRDMVATAYRAAGSTLFTA